MTLTMFLLALSELSGLLGLLFDPDHSSIHELRSHKIGGSHIEAHTQWPFVFRFG